MNIFVVFIAVTPMVTDQLNLLNLYLLFCFICHLFCNFLIFYNKNNYVVIYIVVMEKQISYCEIRFWSYRPRIESGDRIKDKVQEHWD